MFYVSDGLISKDKTKFECEMPWVIKLSNTLAALWNKVAVNIIKAFINPQIHK